MKRTLIALLAVLATTGCAETSRGDAPAGCLEVSDGVADTIAEGARASINAPPRTLNARFASARDVRGTLVVAIYLTGPGGVEDTGLWTVQSLIGDPGQIQSVDEVAKELTYWPAATLTASDIGVGITRDCV